MADLPPAVPSNNIRRMEESCFRKKTDKFTPPFSIDVCYIAGLKNGYGAAGLFGKGVRVGI